jgi:hypothetical protein
MFYSQYILAKRGPLGTIWIAAHLDRKLRKNQIAETDIVSSVRTCARRRREKEGCEERGWDFEREGRRRSTTRAMKRDA